MNRKHTSLYFGKAGELYVMSEFLLRGFNVAVPEVDTGDDIFVIYGANSINPVQVKSANVSGNQVAFTAQFNLSRTQLLQVRSPELFYAFALRGNHDWLHLFLLSRDLLESWYRVNTQRSPAVSQSLTVSFVKTEQENGVWFLGRNMELFDKNFSVFDQ